MIHFTVFQFVAILGCTSSSVYYILCLWSAASFLHEQQAAGSIRPTPFVQPVSILKPLKGVDPDIYESFRSHCLQDYPELFSVSAILTIRRLRV